MKEETSWNIFLQKDRQKIVDLNLCTWFMKSLINKCVLLFGHLHTLFVSQSIWNNYESSVLSHMNLQKTQFVPRVSQSFLNMEIQYFLSSMLLETLDFTKQAHVPLK